MTQYNNIPSKTHSRSIQITKSILSPLLAALFLSSCTTSPTSLSSQEQSSLSQPVEQVQSTSDSWIKNPSDYPKSPEISFLNPNTHQQLSLRTLKVSKVTDPFSSSVDSLIHKAWKRQNSKGPLAQWRITQKKPYIIAEALAIDKHSSNFKFALWQSIGNMEITLATLISPSKQKGNIASTLSEFGFENLSYTSHQNDIQDFKPQTSSCLRIDPSLNYADFCEVSEDKVLKLTTLLPTISNKQLSKEESWNTYFLTVGINPFDSNFNVSNVTTLENPHAKDGNLYRFSNDSSSGYIHINGQKVVFQWHESKHDFHYLNPIKTELPADQKAKRLAALLNIAGLQRIGLEQELQALDLFEKASLLNPTNPNYLLNCAYIYQSNSIVGPGVSHLLSRSDDVKNNGRLAWALGELLEQSYKFEEALKWYKIADAYYNAESEIKMNISDAYWGLGEKLLSLQVARHNYNREPTLRNTYYLARTWIGIGEYQKSLELLDKYYTPEIKDSLYLLTRIQAAWLLQENEKALGTALQAIKEYPETEEFWHWKGQSEYNLKRFGAAIASLKRSIDLGNIDRHTKVNLAASKLHMGIKDNSLIKKKLTPILSLQDWQVIQPDWDSLAQSEGAIITQRKRILKLDAQKPWKESEEWQIYVANQEGVARFNEFTINMLPSFEKLYINHIEIKDSTGKVYTIPKSEIYLTADKGAKIKSSDITIHLVAAQLTAKSQIRVQWTRQGLNSSGFPSFSHRFIAKVPVLSDRFEVLGNPDLWKAEAWGDTDEKITQESTEWKVYNIQPWTNNSILPDFTEYGAGVRIGPNQSWQEAGKSYLDLISSRLKTKIAIKEKAQEIAGNSHTQAEVIEKLSEFVRTKIYYSYESFGNRNIIPYSPAQTIKHKIGDCKDKSVLLQALLSSMGIKSHLGLINLKESISEGVPGIGQFNHMLVYIPSKTPQIIDPSEAVGTLFNTPWYIEDRPIFILDSTNSKLVFPKSDSTRNHGAEFNHRLALNPQGNFDFLDEVVLKGKLAKGFQSKLKELDSNQRHSLLRSVYASQLKAFRFNEFKIENLEGLTDSLKIIIEGSFLSDLNSDKDSKSIFVSPPTPWESLFLSAAKGELPLLRLPHAMKFKSHFQLIGKGVGFGQSKSQKVKEEYLEAQITQTHQIKRIDWYTPPLYVFDKAVKDLQSQWKMLISELNSPLEVKQ